MLWCPCYRPESRITKGCNHGSWTHATFAVWFSTAKGAVVSQATASPLTWWSLARKMRIVQGSRSHLPILVKLCARWWQMLVTHSSPAMQWHYIQSFAVILVQKFCKHDFCRWISLTGSTLLSSAVRQKLFFFKVHFFVTHPHKHFSLSITKKCHRHVHRPPATILHSMTNCAIGSQSFLLQISFLANFEGKMLLSKRRWTRSTLWTRFSEPPTRRKVRKKALKTFTQLRKCAQRSKKKRQHA